MPGGGGGAQPVGRLPPGASVGHGRPKVARRPRGPAPPHERQTELKGATRRPPRGQPAVPSLPVRQRRGWGLGVVVFIHYFAESEKKRGGGDK